MFLSDESLLEKLIQTEFIELCICLCIDWLFTDGKEMETANFQFIIAESHVAARLRFFLPYVCRLCERRFTEYTHMERFKLCQLQTE